jgi:hypothetical protein
MPRLEAIQDRGGRGCARPDQPQPCYIPDMRSRPADVRPYTWLVKGLFFPLTNRFHAQRMESLDHLPSVRRVSDLPQGLPRDPTAIKASFELTGNDVWSLKARTVKAMTSGVAEQRAFYAAAGGGAWLSIRTISERDVMRNIEQDAGLLYREVSLFRKYLRLAASGWQWQLVQLPALPGTIDWSELPGTIIWSDGEMIVNDTPVSVRSAWITEDHWTAWWTSNGLVVELQGTDIVASDLRLAQAP